MQSIAEESSYREGSGQQRTYYTSREPDIAEEGPENSARHNLSQPGGLPSEEDEGLPGQDPSGGGPPGNNFEKSNSPNLPPHLES